MKLLLIQPPIQDFYQTEIRLQPIGLSFLKSSIKKHLPQVEVIIRDYHHGHGRKTIPTPKELDYLQDYYIDRDQSPFSSFDQYYHFGLDFDQIIKDVINISPEMFSIGAFILITNSYHSFFTKTSSVWSKEHIHCACYNSV